MADMVLVEPHKPSSSIWRRLVKRDSRDGTTKPAVTIQARASSPHLHHRTASTQKQDRRDKPLTASIQQLTSPAKPPRLLTISTTRVLAADMRTTPFPASPYIRTVPWKVFLPPAQVHALYTGFFPEELIDTFEPVMREEGRHILFFVNWVAWHRRNMPFWRRPWFEMKVWAVWIALIWERIDMAKGMGDDNTKAQENNFTLNGSKELGVEIEFPELAAICLAENDRRLAVYDPRLIRPKFVPGMIRLVLRFMGKKPARA